MALSSSGERQDGLDFDPAPVTGAPRAESVDDWDQHWDSFASVTHANPAQRWRYRLVLKAIEASGRPARVLDLGSGQGDLLAAMAGRWPDAELLGVEPSESGIRIASAKAPRARFEALDVIDQEPPADRVGWATHAACSEVLEHVNDPVALLTGASRLMAPDCHLVVTVPGGSMSAFDRHIGHRQHFDPATLSSILEAAGFDPYACYGAGFPFFNLYRALVIARGERIVAELSEDRARPSRLVRAGMLAFRPLLAMSWPRSAWGRQIVGQALWPGA